MGRDLARQSGTVSQRIQNAFQRCMTRPPTPTEIEALEAFWKAQLKRFQTRELDPVAVAGPGEGSSVEERAAWATLSRALLNLDEMITKG
jgi:hypothetical protein